MNRRNFVMGMGALPAAAPAGNAQNVLLIYCEQFQHNVASYAGGPARTPNLEKLASEAVDFTTACTTTGLCSPSRSALFTGRLGHRTGLDDNLKVWHSRLSELDPRQTTLIEWGRRENYLVGYYGKWHLGMDGPIRRGAQRYPAEGFERSRNPGKTGAPDFHATRRYYEKGATFIEKPDYFSTAEGTYETSPTAALARQGLGFLKEAATGQAPFFLTLSFNAVHPTYHIPAPYNHMYDWRAVELPASLHDDFTNKPHYQADVMWPFHDTGHMTEDDWRRAIAFYRGYVTMLDRGIGEVLDGLHSHGLRDNTLVVVIADHGDMCGAHNRFDKAAYCYDEIMRIPLLIRAPGIGRRRVTRHVSSIDVNQTIVEWAGLRPDIRNVDSRSLLPLMQRGDSGWSGPDEAFYRYEWYNGLWFGIRAIRTPRYKYCFNPCGPDELYDLEHDSAEMRNLAADGSVRRLREDLARRLLSHLEVTGDNLVASKLRASLDS